MTHGQAFLAGFFLLADSAALAQQPPPLPGAQTFTGAIVDTQLSPNIALLNSTQTFSNQVTFADAVGAFSGNFMGVSSGTNIGTLGCDCIRRAPA